MGLRRWVESIMQTLSLNIRQLQKNPKQCYYRGEILKDAQKVSNRIILLEDLRKVYARNQFQCKDTSVEISFYA